MCAICFERHCTVTFEACEIHAVLKAHKIEEDTQLINNNIYFFYEKAVENFSFFKAFSINKSPADFLYKPSSYKF